MEIKTTNYKIKCDIAGCKNLAKYSIQNRGFIMDNSIYLCQDCADNLYKKLGQVLVPKSPINMLNNNGEKKKKYEKK